MTDISEEALDALQAKLAMSASIWRSHANGERCPTFSRGDCREWAERFESADAAITASTESEVRAKAEASARGQADGNTCEDEGCPHYSTQHSHVPDWVKQYANEQVAGAYLAAADAVRAACDDDNSVDEAIARYAISACTPVDATAALDARDARVRADALREAAEEAKNTGTCLLPSGHFLSERCYAAILALIDKGKTNDP